MDSRTLRSFGEMMAVHSEDGAPPSAERRAPSGEPQRAFAQPSHLISLYVNNKPGVLNRIALVFSRRGWNIDSLAVSEAHDGHFAHCNIVAKGEPAGLHKIVSQLNKLVDVIHATEHAPDAVVSRELALIKLSCGPDCHPRARKRAEDFGGEVIDETPTTSTIELHGTSARIDEAQKAFSREFGVLEVVRTGTIVITRGESET